MIKVGLTDHARKRLRKRLGLKARACQRLANIAFSDGLIASETCLAWKLRQERNPQVMFILYQGSVFVYGISKLGDHPVLVTAYEE